MEGKTGNKGDASNSAFSSTDKMRFCSLTYEIIEELRLRRELAAENEKKIEKLINDRFALGWKLDQERGKLTNLSQRHESELRETRRTLEQKMKDCQVEASQQQVYRKMAEKEKDALKDEIRRLQLSNYSLEKKVRESEHQEKIQANEREQHILQVSRFETLNKQLDSLVKQLTSKQEQLDRDMNVAQKLNKSLQYQNIHQKCVLGMKEADIVKLHQQLLDLQVKVKVDPSKVQEKEEELLSEIRRLRTLLTKLEENNTSLETDKNSWKEKYWDSLKKLDESHRLISVHLHNAASYRDQYDSVEKLQRTTHDTLVDTEHKLQETKKEIENLEHKHKEDLETLETHTSKLNSEKQDLKSQIQNLSSEKEDVEQSLSIAEETISDVKRQLKDAREMLDVEKSDVDCQTSLQMLQMLSTEVQAGQDMQDQASQVVLDTDIGVTQTIDPALCSTEVQTDSCSSERGETQTDNCVTETSEVWNQQRLDTDRNFKDSQTQTDLRTVRNEDESLTNLEKDKFTNIGTEDDFQESASGIKNAESLLLSSDEILHQERERGNNKINVDKKFNQSKSQAEVTVPCTLISGQEALNDKIVTIKTDLKSDNKGACVKENTSLLGAEDDLHCNYAKKVGTFKFTSDSVEKFETTQSINKESKIYESITENRSGNSSYMIQSQIRIRKPLDLEEEKVKDVGLVIPKIDVEKSIDLTGAVSVDPDEFSIKLTQDEEKLDADDTTLSRVSNEVYVSAKKVKELEFSISGKDESGQLVDSHEIDKAIEENWELSNQHAKIFKPRAKKHKLSKETIKNQFQDFDMNKDKFQTSFSKEEEVQPKQPKLAQKSDCKPLPNKQRNYSSMFRIEETAVAENKDKMQLATKTEPQIKVNCSVSKEEIPFTAYDVCGQKGSKYHLPFSRNSQFNSECKAQDMKGLTTLQSVLPTISMMTDQNNISSPVFIAKPLINFANAETVITSSLRQDNLLGQGQENKCSNTSYEDSLEAVGDMSSKDSGISLSDNLSEVGNVGKSESGSVMVKQYNTVGKPVIGPLQTVGLETSKSLPYTPDAGQDADGTSKKSDQGRTTGGSNIDFLQKYKDIVAKIKPVQHHAAPMAKGTQKTTEKISVSPGILNMSECCNITSSGEGTPKGIIKGAQRKDRQTRNVTWNEYVLTKEFVPDGNNSQEND